MTLHVFYNHECAACAAFYIPYDDVVPCPRCGTVASERFDFVREAIRSMKFNFAKVGSYTPDGWYVGSLGDHVLFILFQLFDSFAASGRPDFDQFAKESLAGIEWGEQDYLCGHIEGIAKAIHARITQPESVEATGFWRGFWEEMSRMFPG